MGDPRDSERRRVQRAYEGYERDERVRRRRDLGYHGNRLIEQERRAATREVLERSPYWPCVRVLDLGCGTGGVAAHLLELGAEPAQVVGADLLAFRLRQARQRDDRLRLVQADGRYLCFGEGTFDVVVAFTVFSSILDDGVAVAVALDVDRVLAPGGMVLWYDFRVSHPLNRQTRGRGARSIRSLFPGYLAELRPLTLFPQLARVLGPAAERLYPRLSQWPGLRTHILAVLTKPVPESEEEP